MSAWTKKDLLAGRLIVPAGVEAVLFDLDGVIVDSARFEREAVEEMLGVPVEDGLWKRAFALPVPEFFAELNRSLGLGLSPGRLKEMTHELDRLRVSGPIPLVPGVREIIETAGKVGLRIAVVSNNSPEQIRAILRHHDLDEDFELICGLGSGLRPKPASDLYRQAVEGLRLDPQHCLAVEDSPQGLAAASSAGLKTAGLDVSGADTHYCDFSRNRIEFWPGRPREKELRAEPDFLSHMIEHILWRCGSGGRVVWNNDDYRLLGRLISAELDATQHRGQAIGMIDESLAEVKLAQGTPGATASFVYPWLPGRRVEDLSDGQPLIDLLKGIGEGLGLRIKAEVIHTRDPHHAWEALFRAVGTALSRPSVGAGEIPPARVARNTAESDCQVTIGGEHFLVETDVSGWDELLAGFSVLGLEARFRSEVLISSHVVAEDLGIVLGQAVLRSAEQAMEKTGIEGFGAKAGDLATVAVSLEGRSTYLQLSDRSDEEIDSESFGADIPCGLRIEDLDDFLFGLAQGMRASIITRITGPVVESWVEVFALMPFALQGIFDPRPERRGLIPGVKGTID